MSLRSFLRYLQYEKRYSEHTVLAYKTDLEQVFLYLQSVYELADEKKVSHQQLRSWIVSLAAERQQPRTINRKISTLRAYFKFLQREGQIEINPTRKLRALKLPRRLPKSIREDQAVTLSHQSYGESGTYSQVRDGFLIYTLYMTGLRRSELIGLQDKDVDLNLKQIRVTGKGNKMRLIPVSPDFLIRYKEYLSIRNGFFPETPWVFLTERGTKLYPKLVYNIVSRHISMVSTVSQKGPHTLRHSFATHLSDHGADLHVIKELLGHANLSATQIYTHNSIEKLKEAYRNAHPKAAIS